jgi:two-component system sensor histidine kinase/response regulator
MNVKYEPKNYKILIVDDMPKNLQVLGKNLTNVGYKVQFATSGKMALDWLESKSFDLILLDLMMPEMNGFEVCTIIRQNPKFEDLPIIYLTASTDIEDTVNGFELGAQDYVTKPFNPKELMARIKTQIELKESKIRIKESNNILEKEVKERTYALQIAQSRLLNLDKAKSGFLRIISHEIRTPLNTIIGFTNILKASIETKTLVTYISLLEDAAKRLETFSLDALLITSLQMGSYKLKIQPVNFHELIMKLIDESCSSNPGKPIEYCNSVEKSLTLNADSDLIERCLSIVVTNAIEVSKDNSNIIFDVSMVEDCLMICISDTGPGFSDEALTNLYALFATPDTHVDKNAGISLALVKLIVDAHNGQMQVKNRKKGASVILKFKIDSVS